MPSMAISSFVTVISMHLFCSAAVCCRLTIYTKVLTIWRREGDRLELRTASGALAVSLQAQTEGP